MNNVEVRGMLTCSCDFDGDWEWFFQPGNDFTQLKTMRSRRCKSCGDKLTPGETVLEFFRSRPPRDEVELRIHDEGDSEAIELASWYHCERCGGLYLSLDELGFCGITPDEDMRELVKEYAADYGRGAA